jgi:hypothetical protein
MLGIANKFINFLAIPSSLSRSYSTFPLCSWTTLIETAVGEGPQNAGIAERVFIIFKNIIEFSGKLKSDFLEIEISSYWAKLQRSTRKGFVIYYIRTSKEHFPSSQQRVDLL